jgi:hypothetical protein
MGVGHGLDVGCSYINIYEIDVKGYLLALLTSNFSKTPHTASMDINARTSHVPYPYIYSTPYTHSRGCRATKRGSGRYENPEPTYDRLSDLSTTCSPNVHLGG